MHQRQYGPPQQAQHSLQPLKTHSSYQCMILGMKRRISQEFHISKSSKNKSKSKPDASKTDNKSSKNSSMKQKNNSGSTQGNTSAPKETTSDLLTKLSEDGKLMPQECQCQLNNNLCLFFSNSGHIAKDCSKASAAKACAAKAEQDKSASTSGSEPKKD